MKKILTLILGTLLLQIGVAQIPYKVITVNGEIVATKANLTLKNGLEVKSDDNFNFVRPNSRAALINSDYGRIVLTENNVDDAFSKAAFAPPISTVSARGANIATLPDLKNFFSGDILVIDEMKQKISPSLFQMDNDRYFFLRFTYEDEAINKKLGFFQDSLVINYDEILVIDDKTIEHPEGISQVALYYYDSSKDIPESILINEFNFVFLKTAELKDEVKTIIDEFRVKGYDVVLAEVYDYLNSFYGTIDKIDMEKWLTNNFDIK